MRRWLLIALLLLAGAGASACSDDGGASSADAGRDDAGAEAAPSDGAPSSDADAGLTDAPSESTVDAPGARSCAGPGEDGTRTALCTDDVFTVGGHQRLAVVCKPAPLPSGPLPLVLGFHGGGGNASQWRNTLAWELTAARYGFVFVFMQGCRDNVADCSGSASYLWNVGKQGESSSVDDQAYTLEVIKRLKAVHGLEIDSGCRFATGHSLGGIFSYSLLCDQPTLLTAIGPISATPTDATCTPHGGTSIFHVHGVVDDNVPLDGCCSLAQQTPASAQYLAGCASLARCANPLNWWPPVRSGKHPFHDGVGLDALATGLGCSGGWQQSSKSGATSCYAYPSCAAGRSVEGCLVGGVAHSLGNLDSAVDLRDHLWKRFSSHPAR
ncbi:MAG: hypothetical protein KC503_08515 [Myxococcales bacterium]|nr:hypothetical protein [Myxococcales bacterium]